MQWVDQKPSTRAGTDWDIEPEYNVAELVKWLNEIIRRKDRILVESGKEAKVLKTSLVTAATFTEDGEVKSEESVNSSDELEETEIVSLVQNM